jgi:nitric oxide reductase large subunit
MSASTLNAQTRGFGLSVAITSIISALLVIVKESNEGLLKFMKTITVHHWVTHGIFDVLVFLAIGFLLSKSNGGNGPDIDDGKLLQAIVAGFLLGCVLIGGFYLIEG